MGGGIPVQDTKTGMGILTILGISHAKNILMTLSFRRLRPYTFNWILKAAPKLLSEDMLAAWTYFVANFLSGQNVPCKWTSIMPKTKFLKGSYQCLKEATIKPNPHP